MVDDAKDSRYVDARRLAAVGGSELVCRGWRRDSSRSRDRPFSRRSLAIYVRHAGPRNRRRVAPVGPTDFVRAADGPWPDYAMGVVVRARRRAWNGGLAMSKNLNRAAREYLLACIDGTVGQKLLEIHRERERAQQLVDYALSARWDPFITRRERHILATPGPRVLVVDAWRRQLWQEEASSDDRNHRRCSGKPTISIAATLARAKETT